jgi:PEP-CTERM motif
VSVAALFVLAGASFARADVTRLNEIAMDTTRVGAAYTIATWPSSAGLRRAGTLSGCIGAYQATVEAMVFHSACQGTNILSESGHDQAAMAFRTPISPVFYADRALESSFGISGVAEMPILRADWFGALERISASRGAIDAATIYSGAGSRPGTFMTRSQSAEESGPLDLGEDMDHHVGNPDLKHHPRKEHDGDDDLAPEPSTLLLLGTGTFILGAVLRRRLTTAA